ncbi:hypothetical protein TVAG_309600 [Trichomonas vaginalis G3]|uniref:BTB domain-containing protein n=1 Tax=Trichomonas vaginalis (strain ATCC PRA-98 / G3) TaxID=412133 RepID=A2FGD7_TRIV3|nr:protein ubiquitination [Trichomonas vaginalis G3]EAX96041.1 hypothetical protein TVAG_309600 [Trichomonas vaginalis G3]KAI5491750.1 protein ubiquitination [Trichomonas vaginalis G3]|eukprot:XP_001308971.1 hypothetical protein [Trichomonas vaginalis G3]
MSDFQFIIDSHYCKNSSLLKIGIDFSFIINGNRFVTTQNHASVISGIVRDILITDESATEINISIPDNGSLEKSLNIFSIFLRNGYIKENIDLLTSETLYHIGVSIENEDFINQYINIMTISNITKDNIKSFINYSLKTHDFEKTSTFIASNLSHIGPSICSSLIQSVFDTIKD